MTEVREYRQRRFAPPPGACELLLVRHGASLPAREDRPFPLVDGHGDPALEPLGHEQAAKVADRLAGERIAAIYVSNLQRTAETAAPLAARLGIEPRVEPDLREVFLGEWEGGLLRKYAAEGHPIAVKMFAEGRWDVIPGGEPADEFAARVQGAITRIAEAHPGEAVAAFTHGGVIGQILGLATDARPFAFTGSDNGGISHLVVTAERWIVRAYNDTAHLHASFSTAPEPMT
jgi:2,3-bisphosphoglycerate-dependent phosphoglycerate mutase